MPLTLVVWQPIGDDEEARHTLTWELIISELPLLLDPAKTPVHQRLIKHVEQHFAGHSVESIYWYRASQCHALPDASLCRFADATPHLDVRDPNTQVRHRDERAAASPTSWSCTHARAL